MEILINNIENNLIWKILMTKDLLFWKKLLVQKKILKILNMSTNCLFIKTESDYLTIYFEKCVLGDIK